MDRLHSVAELLEYIEKNFHKEQAFSEKNDHGWIYMSHQEFLLQIKFFALYLKKLGIQKGDKVGILALPGIRWTIVDLAIMSIGGVTVPLFANISEENFIFQCTQTEMKTICVLGTFQWEMYERHKNLFDRVIALDGSPVKEAIVYDTAIKEGSGLHKKSPYLFQELLDQIDENDMATIIYTSGSTGIPKGVVLTHRALLMVTYHNPFDLTESDRYLSILPLAHIFARSVNFIMMRWNVTIYYFNQHKQIGDACREIMPTAIAMVPRILERIYAKMVADVNEAGCLKKSIGNWAFSIAMHASCLKHFLFHPLADSAVFKTLRAALGSHIRLVFCGGAPLKPALTHFFNEIGIPIYEGYGLTEASIVSYNSVAESQVGTVGKPDPQVEVKISPEGEILVRSQVVFREYYKNPEKTEQTLDHHGWLHTGDKATMDHDGYITLVGRIEELVKTSTGEWVAEVPLEQELSSVPFVEFAMVVAEKRKLVSALIFPNFEVVGALKKSQNLEHLTDEEYLNSGFIRQEMEQLIKEINSHHNHWEQIHAYRFVMQPASVETGELTPTLKIRREFVQRKYNDLIDSMYTEQRAS